MRGFPALALSVSGFSFLPHIPSFPFLFLLILLVLTLLCAGRMWVYMFVCVSVCEYKCVNVHVDGSRCDPGVGV